MLSQAKLQRIITNLPGLSHYKWRNRPSGLYCFNYHRVGTSDDSFDPNVFSCTEERFEEHLKFFKKDFDVISLEELLKLPLDQSIKHHRFALITFDDGYLDNFTKALPILNRQNLSAVFFIATNYIDFPEIPWWDQVAWLVRHTNVNEVRLDHWRSSVDIATGDIDLRIRRLLKAVKTDNSTPLPEKLEQLKDKLSCETQLDPNSVRLFMNWDELKKMCQAGMYIGSHTCSHSLLSHLSPQDQKAELFNSKKRLEEQLGVPIKSLAYPGGGSDTFSTVTQDIAKEAGYSLVFSFITGINQRLSGDHRFELWRLPVAENMTTNALKKQIISSKTYT